MVSTGCWWDGFNHICTQGSVTVSHHSLTLSLKFFFTSNQYNSTAVVTNNGISYAISYESLWRFGMHTCQIGGTVTNMCGFVIFLGMQKISVSAEGGGDFVAFEPQDCIIGTICVTHSMPMSSGDDCLAVVSFLRHGGFPPKTSSQTAHHARVLEGQPRE